MFLDSRLELSDKQAVTATAPSTHTVDFGQKAPNLGGSPTRLYAVMTVSEDFAGLTGFTLALEHSDQESAAFTPAVRGETLKATDLKAGAQYVLPLPMQHKRFVRGHYTVAGTATTGKVSLHIVSGLQGNKAMPDSPRVWGGK